MVQGSEEIRKLEDKDDMWTSISGSSPEIKLEIDPFLFSRWPLPGVVPGVLRVGRV
jgi:hypothetical protein